MSDEPEVQADEEGGCGCDCGEQCGCGTSCCECELSPEDLAVVSLCTGAMSILLTLAFGGPLVLLGLACAATAVVTGYLSLRCEHRREKLAENGLVCGSIGIAFWLLHMQAHQALLWLARHLT